MLLSIAMDEYSKSAIKIRSIPKVRNEGNLKILIKHLAALSAGKYNAVTWLDM